MKSLLKDDLFKSLADSSPSLVWFSDSVGTLVYFNKTWLNFTGLRMDEASSGGWLEIVHPDDLPGCRAAHREGFAKKARFEIEYRILHHDKQYRWIRAVAQPWLADDGVYRGHVGSCHDVTEDRQRIEELRNTKERLELAHVGSKDGLWDWDIRTGKTFFSVRWKEMLGYTDSEIENTFEAWNSLIHPEDQSRVQTEVQRHFRERSTYAIEHRLKCKDGSYKWILARGQAIWGEQGKPVRMAGSHTDLTEIRQRDLLISQQVNALNLSNAVAISNVEGQIQFVNNIFCETCGYSEKELLGQNFRILNSGYHPKDFFGNLWRTIKRGETWQGRVRNRRKDGDYYWGDVVIVPFKNEAGAVFQFVSLRRDITREMNLIEALQTSNERWSSLMKNAPVGIFETDTEGQYIYVNDKWTSITGLSREKAFGSGWTTSIYQEDQPSVTAAWQEALNGGSSFVAEYRYKTSQGQVVWVICRAFGLREPSGKVTGYLGSIEDITPIKETQKKLEKASAEALTASEMKSDFLASMSHEIRTPMNGILGLANLLADTSVTETQREYLSGVIQSGESLLALINDVLDLSKIEAGRMRLEEGPFNIERLVVDTLNLFRSQAMKKAVELRLIILPGTSKGWEGDSGRVRQVIVNLVGNAVKFTEKGFVAIHISNWVDNGVAKGFVVEVEDTGIGIAPEAITKLFSDFVQGGPEISNKYGGTGLGLAISRKLARMMGGDIHADSVLGKGSVFTARIKAKAIEITAESMPHGSPAVLTGSKQFSGRVLVAEDNPINQRVIKAQLAKFGLRVDVAANGFEAIKACAEFPYDLIFMDCMMPELDGFEATREIRKREAGGQRKIPIVAMTAKAMTGDREKCLSSGMDDYISKPVDVTVLTNCLARWLNRWEGSAPEVILSLDMTSKLEELGADDPTLVSDLVQMFISSTPEKLSKLKEAYESRDAKQMTFHAHTLKSSSATLGAQELREVFAKLEANGLAGNLGVENAELLEKARSLFSKTAQALEDFLKSPRE